MKTIKQVLQLILEEIENTTLWDYSGMCSIVSELSRHNQITLEEKYLFDHYWNEYAFNRENKVFYYNSLDKTSSYTDTYGWKPHNMTPRVKWLKKHIKLNT